MSGLYYQMDFFGSGYGSIHDSFATAPPLKVHTTITGPEPGYLVCSIVCGQCTFTLLDEIDAAAKGSSNVPAGVMTPAPAFRGTDLVERLHSEGGM